MEDSYEGFEEFTDRVSEEGLDLLSDFSKVLNNNGFIVTPLLIGDKKNQVGFSIIDNREKQFVNKYELMLRKKI